MFTRRVAAILATLVLAVSVAAIWSAQGDERDGDTSTNVVAASGAEAGADAPTPKKKGGSLFGKIFKAPLKAVGRLFGKGDDDKLARMNEKDSERFESTAVLRVEDRDNARPAPPAEGGSARDYLERGRALLEEGRLNDAIAELSRAASLDPKLSQAHSLLAVAYDRKGLHERAEDSYKHAIDVNENDPQALNNLGYSLYINGNYRAAVDKLKRAARLAHLLWTRKAYPSEILSVTFTNKAAREMNTCPHASLIRCAVSIAPRRRDQSRSRRFVSASMTTPIATSRVRTASSTATRTSPRCSCVWAATIKPSSTSRPRAAYSPTRRMSFDSSPRYMNAPAAKTRPKTRARHCKRPTRSRPSRRRRSDKEMMDAG